jgi:hypothetical protein
MWSICMCVRGRYDVRFDKERLMLHEWKRYRFYIETITPRVVMLRDGKKFDE